MNQQGDNFFPDPVRREQILGLAIVAARRKRVARRARKALAVMVPTIFVTALVLMRHAPPAVAIKSTVSSHTLPITPSPVRSITVVLIQTDPRDYERMKITSMPSHYRFIDDRELLQSLADAGHPSGLAYVDGTARLLEQR